ncbi:gastrula zinc finger protein XlCGF66.1-like isoform X2 [Varroa jacobsoni]|uniref:C2H2-type domain-containing protein n=1 Tax=Varroa destructor TaxID=109461 RepID=A0A7M7JSK6_VARDE|nr:gastrula zinc finger protein XlCGF66.1-like isoform X3 [Varroa destructor]XP_022685677.1 gastrula zinc finger protein XlCGF66.1-like isoform X2 [Varroa jacobsoni]
MFPKPRLNSDCACGVGINLTRSRPRALQLLPVPSSKMDVNPNVINASPDLFCITQIYPSCKDSQPQFQQLQPHQGQFKHPQLIADETPKTRSTPKPAFFPVGSDGEEITSKPNNSVTSFGTTSRMVYGCHLCEASSTSAVQLNFHLQRVHQLYPCAECKLLFQTRDSLASHELLQHRGHFPCEFCGKVLETHRKYIGHRKNHRTQNSCCYYCGLSVSSKDDMTAHIERVHPRRQFTCALCHYSRTFPSRSDLLAHRRECALDPLQCRVCKQFYQTPEELLKHSEYHTKQQLYYHCEICGEVTIAAPLLQRHLREVHDCSCPDALIETFAMTMPRVQERQKEGYRPEEARKRMTDFVLMSKRITISITRGPATQEPAGQQQQLNTKELVAIEHTQGTSVPQESRQSQGGQTLSKKARVEIIKLAPP